MTGAVPVAIKHHYAHCAGHLKGELCFADLECLLGQLVLIMIQVELDSNIRLSFPFIVSWKLSYELKILMRVGFAPFRVIVSSR